jgi:hypothetical protein
LVFWKPFTVPEKVTSVSASNIAEEWCANAGAAPKLAANANVAIPNKARDRMIFLPTSMLTGYSQSVI